MSTTLKPTFRPAKVLRVSSAFGLVVALSGCLALPPAIQIASLALDGFSYMSTGKSVSDHAISAFANKDCAVHRALKDVNGICIENATPDIDITVASGEADIGSSKKQQMEEISEIWLTSNVEYDKEMSKN
ncbi:MAG: hypothetical protein OEL50_03895 [Rhodospirillaceae bacterium]|nr:hypothetical protein [Rhodospirillaceae bacterium]